MAERSHAAWALAHRYPPEPLLMPTRLGSALRTAEDRAGRRYGLDTTAAWPRLYPLLSERVAALVDDQRTQMDLAARFTAVLLGATAVSLPFLEAFFDRGPCLAASRSRSAETPGIESRW